MKTKFLFLLLALLGFSVAIDITGCSVLSADSEVYVLQNDISGADCIRITGENITFNLNGHNVNGYGGDAIIIENTRGVVVENGTAYSSNGGLVVIGSRDSTIRNFAVSTLSGFSIHVIDSANISFSEVNYSRGLGSAGAAILFINMTDSLMENSRCTLAAEYNGEYSEYSGCIVLTSNSNNNMIVNNYFSNAYRNGVFIYKSYNNTISGNTIENSHWYGVAVRDAENNTITGNRFVGSGLVHLYFDESGKNNTYDGNENEDGDPIVVFIDQENITFENNKTSEIVLFNITNATFRNITMVEGGINILGNGVANITFDGFTITGAGAAIFLNPSYENITFLNGAIADSTYGFYGTLDRKFHVENLNATNIARYPIGLDIPSDSACGEVFVSNYTVDGNSVQYTTSDGFTLLPGKYSQVFMCSVSGANLYDMEITHGLFFYYSGNINAGRINISGAYIPVKLLNSDGIYFEDFIIENARVEGMNILNSNNIEIHRTNITTVSDSSIPTFHLVDWRYTDVGVYTSGVDGFILNESRIENADASLWMRRSSRNVNIYGSTFRNGMHGIIMDNVQYGVIESNVFSDFSQSGITANYANQTQVMENNLTNAGGDINSGAINFYGGRDISVFRNRINARSGIIFSSAYASSDYLTEFSIYENEIKNIPGTAGVYVRGSYGSATSFSITYNNISTALNGVRLWGAKEGIVCYNRIENAETGIYAIDSGELTFCDSEMKDVSNFPVFLDYTNETFCGSTNVSNVTHGGEAVEYYNNLNGITIENIDDSSEIILCDVNDSIIRNIEMKGSEGERGILAVLSNRNSFYDNTGRDVYSMTYLLRSNGNNLSNYTVNNATYGVMVDISSGNIVENSLTITPSGYGVYVYRDSDNNTIQNMNVTGQISIYGSYWTAENNIIIGNDVNGTGSGDRGISIGAATFTLIQENRIYDGEIQVYASGNNVSYNNFTGTCSGWQCVRCSGENNLIYKNFFNLSSQPYLGAILVGGTTNNVSRNYFATTIVRVDSGNVGCGNLYGVLNVSGPTGITNTSCFPGNITEMEIFPTPVYESSNASCRAYYTHEDPYDAKRVEFRWYVNGVHLPAYDGYGSGARDSWIETNVSLPANESSAGDNITCEARAYDGAHWTEWVNETVEVAPDTCGVYVNETSVFFGSLTTNVISDEKSISVINPGTIPGNISINGTDWVGPAVFSSTRTRWSKVSGSYDSKTPLTSTPALVYENLPGGSSFLLYLQLYTPIGQQNGTYNQTITMVAECP